MGKRYYLPTRESELVDFIGILLKICLKRKTEWRLDTQDLKALQTSFITYESLFNKCQANETRTPVLVAKKNLMRLEIRRVVQQFVQGLQNNPRMTDDGRVDLGIPIRKRAGPKQLRNSQAEAAEAPLSASPESASDTLPQTVI
jgi:hypothetical protein